MFAVCENQPCFACPGAAPAPPFWKQGLDAHRPAEGLQASHRSWRATSLPRTSKSLSCPDGLGHQKGLFHWALLQHEPFCCYGRVRVLNASAPSPLCAGSKSPRSLTSLRVGVAAAPLPPSGSPPAGTALQPPHPAHPQIPWVIIFASAPAIVFPVASSTCLGLALLQRPSSGEPRLWGARGCCSQPCPIAFPAAVLQVTGSIPSIGAGFVSGAQHSVISP